MSKKNLLLIFTRNPELGKCKTRLAATIGDQAALNIYSFLLEHTRSLTQKLDVSKQVHYSVKIRENDLWDPQIYDKRLQIGQDLGDRMNHAFAEGFASGYEHIVIIGSDMYDLSTEDIEASFLALQSHDYVIGPATDGGYYLLGMKSLTSQVFKNKKWGTASVLKDTVNDLQNNTIHLLEERNDIDIYEDIKDIDVFQKFLTQ
ncbi:TIGR04282 family arsenosugar biosynthesis glycosyltransferase [Aquimarina sp. U1-2]|uniref:TIGR04282 family arsenosugar biosynthesis glycosyltransferase n=1 Tax=Aquimarina sp. U1-2 TaxID=2823141 RepID=UPI001FED8D2B|nr:TIGR04282 family arsenosugar biosynthesis glycosyltransferase [Aquimarina sp. U1-2]